MMAPFDGPGGPPNGQPGVAPQPLGRPMQPGQHNPQGMHHQPMGPPPYHRGSVQMPPGQAHYVMPPQSPAGRQGSYRGMHGQQFAGHPPLHSPHHQHQQPSGGMPSHPMQQIHRNGSMSRQHNVGMPMQPPLHDPMRGPSSAASHQRPPPQYGMDTSRNSTSSSGRGDGGSWQSQNDTPHRREMIQHIVKLLKKDKGGSPESINKLPQMAKQLEVSLYRSALSFEAYMDMATLKQRLQQIAMEVSRKSRRNDQMNSQDFSMDRRDRRSDPMNGSNSPYGGGGGMSRPNPSRMVDMSDINPMVSGGRQPNNNTAPVYGGGNGGGRGMQQQTSSSVGPSSLMGNRNDPEMKIRIRHKQQRLLLLHHSAKCTEEEGRCSVTPHCADMKRLWRHMEECKDNQCRVPHCFSSRAILSHYRKCKDPACPACGPVRETVRKSRVSARLSGSSGVHPMRDMSGSSGVHGGHGIMSSSSDPLSGPMGGSFPPGDPGLPDNSFQQPPGPGSSSSMAKMPPPHNPMSTNNTLPSPSSHFGQANMGSSSVQPLYGSDRSQMDGRMQPRSDSSSLQLSASASRNHSSTMNGSNNGGNNKGGRNDSEWQRIRHKQQRLLLLRHASRCPHEPGKCTTTPHCASMKKLWEHIAHCKNQDCTVQHCLSSRYVLSHYRRCKEPRCPACGPVRDTIRRSHDRDRNRAPGTGQSFDSLGREETITPSSTHSLEPERKRPRLDDVPSAAEQLLPPPPSVCQPVIEDKIINPEPQPEPSTTVVSMPPEPQPEPPPPPAPAPAPVAPPVPPPPPQEEPVVKVEPVSSQKVPPQVTSGKETGKKSVKTAKIEDYSLLESFTVRQLQTHLAALERKAQLPQAKLKPKCGEILKGLQTHQHGWVFNCPVDPVELGLPDYFDIIKKPMDLGTIQKKLENGAYHAIDEFSADVHLTFDNAMTYNEDGSVVYDMAKELKSKFLSDLKKLTDHLDAEDREKRQNDRACTLCGCEKRLFEPPVYFCNGLNCQSQRIRRNSHFYIGGNNQYFWCSSCFNELDEKIPIELVDMTIMKADLKKKKNDEVHEESWVQCDTCERWVHQICGLFNTRQNKEHQSIYCCPRCLLDKRENDPLVKPKPAGASDLPRTTLSEWLEHQITKRILKRKRELAEEKSQIENITLEEATRQVESGGTVIVRQVTSMDRKLEVRDLMRKRYAHKNYPEEFPFRCKCILVFQRLDGVDVVLFALYVYEHNEQNPPPNQRVVYISYLDSVHFMRPRKLRTFVYHEILIAYLDYARRKGYSTAHIWACPPLKGDDYIFYAKPEDQKTPRDSRLRQWYIDMLIEAQKRNIVGKVTNMYDLYFADEKLDATAVPYLEGDYFPGEVENIIKLLEEGGGKKGGGGGKKKKSKASKNKGGLGTRSNGVDEEALIASGAFEGARSFKDLDRDQVMVKLGETILPMKDSFIVAFLNWTGARDEDMIVPEEIEIARKEYAANDDGDLAGSKRDAIGNVRDMIASGGKNSEGFKVIDDDDEDLDCEFLNNRQAFLNLCRGNHYQFDELRRAKHTSMMVLWHLHNRDAPKFVQQCVSCSREILSGTRYHCNVCQDYDMCQECYRDPKSNRGACTHELQAIAVDAEAAKERSGLSEQERMARQRNLMLHIQLIEHASRCQSSSCSSSNCAKMKQYLHHARICRTKVQGGCRICKRIWTLLRIHAQKCKDNKCPIPQCNAIREKMRQLQKQQQAMDDRRRVEMNRHMRFSGTTG